MLIAVNAAITLTQKFFHDDLLLSAVISYPPIIDLPWKYFKCYGRTQKEIGIFYVLDVVLLLIK